MYLRALPLSCSLALASAPALALDPLPPPPRALQLTLPGGPAVDASVLAVSATAIVLGSYVFEPPSTGQVAPLDGLGHRDANPVVSGVTDLVLGVGLVGSLGVSLAGSFARGSRGWEALRAPLVLAEAAGLALGVASVVKDLVNVCRPRSWNDATATCDGASAEERRSFPSGHTAPLAGLAGASLGLWLLPSGRPDPWAAGLFVGTSVLTLGNLTMRVEAGAHSWVDTGVGAGLGFGLGFATALLHVRRSPVRVVATGSGLALSGVW